MSLTDITLRTAWRGFSPRSRSSSRFFVRRITKRESERARERERACIPPLLNYILYERMQIRALCQIFPPSPRYALHSMKFNGFPPFHIDSFFFFTHR